MLNMETSVDVEDRKEGKVTRAVRSRVVAGIILRPADLLLSIRLGKGGNSRGNFVVGGVVVWSILVAENQ